MRITLRRSGMFKCNWSDFGNRCGTDPQPIQEYRYQCEIETTDVLDEQGFIVDQLDVNNTMQQLFYPEPTHARSCERIAIAAVFSMLKLINERSVAKAYRVTIGVGVVVPKNSKEDALITAEWRP
jgi:hypothetical protein